MLRHGVDARVDVLIGYGSNITSLTQSYFKRDTMQHLIPFPGNRLYACVPFQGNLVLCHASEEINTATLVTLYNNCTL